MSSPKPARRQRFGAILRQLLPYVVVIVAISWVIHTTRFSDLKAALTHAPLGWFLAISAVILVLNCAADTFAMGTVFRWFGVDIRFRDLYVMRASTYFLAILNYHVGQAAIAGYLYRGKRVPLIRATGIILFIIGINVGTLFLLASAGASQAGGQLAFLHWVPLVCGVGVVAYGGLLLWKPPLLAERRILAPLFEMGVWGHVKGVVVRLPHVLVLMIWHFVSLRLFNVQITPGAAVLYLPAFFAVAALPVNINGVGLAQVVALAFFAPFVATPSDVTDPHRLAELRAAAVNAYSISVSSVSIVLQIALGLLCMKRATRLGISSSAAEVAEAGTERVEMASASAPPEAA